MSATTIAQGSIIRNTDALGNAFDTVVQEIGYFNALVPNGFSTVASDGTVFIHSFDDLPYLEVITAPMITPSAELEEAYQDDFYTEFEEAATPNPMQTALARKDYAIESVVLQGEYHDYDAMQEITEELAREFLGVAA